MKRTAAPVKRLWAPWRAEYIYCAAEESGTDSRHCLFCRLLRERNDAHNLILCRRRHGFVVMNRFPYNSGHLLIAPRRHVADPERLSAAEAQDLFRLLQLSLAALRQAFRPRGYNLGVNLGRVAGAGVTGHVHLHVVPRWQGDVNFMPLLAETKVVSEHLLTTYQRLLRYFGQKPGAKLK